MKKILIVTLLAVSFSSAAYAQTTTPVSSSNTVSGTGAGAVSGPNTQDTRVHTESGASAVTGGVTDSNNFTIEAAVIPNDVTNRQVISGGTNSTNHQTFGTQTIKNTPSVSGPPLTASNDTCMGSASGSANGPGFGISIGKTYVDPNCVMLKNSRELWNMGMKAAAMARMCMDEDNRKALEMTGFSCPQATRKD